MAGAVPIGTGTFTVAEARRIEQLVPHSARAWRAALLAATSGAIAADVAPAVVVLDEANQIEGLTPGCRDLLDQLPPGRAGPTPDVLTALAISARVTTNPAEQAPTKDWPTTRTMIRGADGSWLLLEGARLSGHRNLVAVTIRRAGRSEVGELLLRAYELTNRETQVALAVLRNETNQEIALALSITAWTVQDHLKAIFAKTRAASKQDQRRCLHHRDAAE